MDFVFDDLNEEDIDMPVDILTELRNINDSMDNLMARNVYEQLVEFAEYEIHRVNEFRAELLRDLDDLLEDPLTQEDRRIYWEKINMCYITMQRLHRGYVEIYMRHIGQTVPMAEAQIIPVRVHDLVRLMADIDDYPRYRLTLEQLHAKKILCLRLIDLAESLYHESQQDIIRCVHENRPLSFNPYDPHVPIIVLKQTTRCVSIIINSIIPQLEQFETEV
jgi:hypothetical protein